MADSPLLGPNGQPIQPNPFTQPQGRPATVNVDLGTAQRALDEFTSRLETTLTRLFNYREKSLKNLHAGEKGYWEMANNYANTYYGMLNKQHDMRLQKLKQEQAVKEDMIRRDVKNQDEAQKQILRLQEDYQNKAAHLKQRHSTNIKFLEGSETIFGGVQRAASLALPGTVGPAMSEFGNLMTSAASGAMLFSTAIVLAAKAASAWAERQAELSRTSAGLVAAGFGLSTGRGDVESLRKRIFGGTFDRLLSPTEQRSGLGILGQSPALLGEAATNSAKFQNTLFRFGNIMPNTNELMQLFATNSKELGLNLDEMSNVFTVSRLASMKMSHTQKDFNINQRDTIDLYLSLQKAFRNFTTDGNVAAGTLLGISSVLKNVAKGPGEIRQFGEAIGGGVSNIKFAQALGMFAFTNNGALPTEAQAFGPSGSFNNMPKLMGNFLKKITSQFGPGSQQEFVAKGQLQEQFFPNLPMRLIPEFNKIVAGLQSSTLSDKEAQKKMEQLDKESKSVTVKGQAELINATSSLTQIENKLFGFWNDILNNPAKAKPMLEALTPIGLTRRAADAVARSVKGARHGGATESY